MIVRDTYLARLRQAATQALEAEDLTDGSRRWWGGYRQALNDLLIDKKAEAGDLRPTDLVAGFCPTCGREQLYFISRGHSIVCMASRCPDPEAVNQLFTRPKAER